MDDVGACRRTARFRVDYRLRDDGTFVLTDAGREWTRSPGAVSRILRSNARREGL